MVKEFWISVNIWRSCPQRKYNSMVFTDNSVRHDVSWLRVAYGYIQSVCSYRDLWENAYKI